MINPDQLNERKKRMDEPKPVFDKEYCDKNNINSKWFKFDDDLANLLLIQVEESVYPPGNSRAGEWFLDGAYTVGLVMIAILQYKMNGYIEYPELEQLLMGKREYKIARTAYRKAVENIDKSRIQCAEKIWNGTHAHDKYKR